MQVLRQGLRFSGRFKAFLLGAFFSAFILGVGGVYFFQKEYSNKFYEGILIDQVDVSGLTQEKALQKLRVSETPATHDVTISANEATVTAPAAQLGLHREYDEVMDRGMQYGRSGKFFTDVQSIFKAYTKGQTFESHLAYDPIKVQDFVNELAFKSSRPGEEPKAVLKNGVVEVSAGKTGTGLNIEETSGMILSSANSDTYNFTALLHTTGIQLNEAQLNEAKQRAEKLIGKSIQGKVDVTTVDIPDTQLVSILTFPNGYNDAELETLMKAFQDKFDRPAQDAKFSYNEQTLDVTEFQPDLDGITISKDQTKEEVRNALKSFEAGNAEKQIAINVPVVAKKADKTLETLNPLGLKERIGFGETFYHHSIPSRVHNVSQASKIINNTIVKPGEEFSFNKTLGDVSKATGFLPAYVIQGGQTVLGDGGGVCQVSTTLFRALLDSGLQITKRKAHSYRVSYYELNKDPGFDATVFSGEVDLRFVNDSPGHVLLHFETFPDQRYMFVTIYGTSDGRVATISEYRKWGARGAPPAVMIPDPSLAPGQRVQIDWAVGGIKAEFKHTVKDKDGNIKYENTYYSNYIPWSAKYRVGV